MPVEVRRLTADDWRDNRAIRLEALAECPGAYATTLAQAQARGDDAWRGMMMSATLTIFGLFDGPDLAGIAAIDRDGSSGAVLAMSYIRPRWRGRGHSGALFAARLEWARERGIARIVVSHRASNHASRRAIERHGFRRIAARPRLWPDGVVEDDIICERILAPA